MASSPPIGISFIPSASNVTGGPSAAGRESVLSGGPSTDLAQAYKVLSLRLPQVLGASAPAAPALLNSAGASGLPNLPSGLSPYAALFQALLKASVMPGGFSPDLAGLFGGGASSAPDPLASPMSMGGTGAPGTTSGGIDTPAADSGRPVPRVQFPSAVSSLPDAPQESDVPSRMPDRQSPWGNY